MKLIIDIDDKRIKGIKLLAKEQDIATLYPTLEQIIANGIPFDNLRAEIYQLYHHPKLDFIKNDEVVDMALEIIDKYAGVSE